MKKFNSDVGDYSNYELHTCQMLIWLYLIISTIDAIFILILSSFGLFLIGTYLFKYGLVLLSLAVLLTYLLIQLLKGGTAALILNVTAIIFILLNV